MLVPPGWQRPGRVSSRVLRPRPPDIALRPKEAAHLASLRHTLPALANKPWVSWSQTDPQEGDVPRGWGLGVTSQGTLLAGDFLEVNR